MLYAKTETGRTEVQSRSLPLTPAQRRVLILCDGERHLEDLGRMMPPESVRPALEQLLAKGLLALQDDAVKEQPIEIPLTDAERFRASVQLATSMAAELGFAARVKAQLQIERAQGLPDLVDTVKLLCKHQQTTPLMELRMNKLRELAGV